jgi:hypothetical protein
MCLTSSAKGDALWGRVSLLIKSTKRLLTEYSPQDPPTPQTGANKYTMRGAEGPCGAQASRDLRTSRKSWV